MVTYETAIQLWGALRLRERAAAEYETTAKSPFRSTRETLEWHSWKEHFEPVLDTVRVQFHFYEGYACCGGADPDCYCSFAESPSAYVEISGADAAGNLQTLTIDVESFDFATVLKEIVTASGGIVPS